MWLANAVVSRNTLHWIVRIISTSQSLQYLMIISENYENNVQCFIHGVSKKFTVRKYQLYQIFDKICENVQCFLVV